MKIIEKPKLPKEIFAVEVKPQLLAQAVRVYLANQRQGTQSVLTRAEVNRTRKKFQKQKGSGNARHGDRKAPIFVGGGIAFAPKPRDYTLKLSAKMRRMAINGALTEAAKANKLSVVSGLEKLAGKTKELAQFLNYELGISGVSSPSSLMNYGHTLIITDKTRENVWRAGRNIEGVTVLPFNQLNTYEVLKARKIILMKEIFGEDKPVKKTRKTKIKK